MAIENSDFTKKELTILAFDHRGTFEKELLGIKGRPVTPDESKKITNFKKIIFKGYLSSLEKGVNKETSGILCDDEFGYSVLNEARIKQLNFAVPVEKSGQEVFDFQHDSRFAKAIEEINPTFSKVLVRFNPEGNEEDNSLQLARLKLLSDYLTKANRGFLFELIVVPTASQLNSLNNSSLLFDTVLRPKLVVESMSIMQQVGIEPDIWKLEGVDTIQDAKMLVSQAQEGGRKAGVIILGRGESEEKVDHWIKISAQVNGIIGFAVGRTIFWESLVEYNSLRINEIQAANEISMNYVDMVKLWDKSKTQSD